MPNVAYDDCFHLKSKKISMYVGKRRFKPFALPDYVLCASFLGGIYLSNSSTAALFSFSHCASFLKHRNKHAANTHPALLLVLKSASNLGHGLPCSLPLYRKTINQSLMSAPSSVSQKGTRNLSMRTWVFLRPEDEHRRSICGEVEEN
jgi:hypothetical protein